VDLKRQLFFF